MKKTRGKNKENFQIIYEIYRILIFFDNYLTPPALIPGPSPMNGRKVTHRGLWCTPSPIYGRGVRGVRDTKCIPWVETS